MVERSQKRPVEVARRQYGGGRSAYWVPSMIDTADGQPLVPTRTIWYYKTGYLVPADSTMVTPPPGLRMIAGDASNDREIEHDWQRPYRWHCALPDGHGPTGASIPDCAPGSSVALEVFFPQCWNGVDLDSPDQSHVVHADGSCPSTHPRVLPRISLNIDWLVEEGRSGTNWRLASDADEAGAPEVSPPTPTGSTAGTST